MSRDALDSVVNANRMANHRHGRDHEKEKKSDAGLSAADLLLHPELLSNDFLKLILHEVRNFTVVKLILCASRATCTPSCR